MLGAGEGAEAAGDLLPDFRHADVSLGQIVVERNVGVGGEREVGGVPVTDPPGQGPMFGSERAGVGMFAWVGAEPGGVQQEPGLLGQHEGIGCLPGRPGGVDGGSDAQVCVEGLLGPAPAADRAGGSAGGVVVGDDGELAQNVSSAQDVAGVCVGVIRCPRVMHGDRGPVGQDAAGVDRFNAAAAVHVQQREPPGASAMQPVQSVSDAEPDLVEVDQRLVAELVAGGVGEPTRNAQRIGGAGGDRRDGSCRDGNTITCAVRALDGN